MNESCATDGATIHTQSRKPRFGLRSLFVATGLVAVWLGWKLQCGQPLYRFDQSDAVLLFFATAFAGGTVLVYLLAPRR